MPSSSRIVFAEDVVGAAPWEPGRIEGAPRRRFERRTEPAEPRDPGFDEGLRQGFEQGVAHERARAAARERERLQDLARRTDQLIGATTAQLVALQQRVADDLVGLAVEIARRAVGAAIRLRPEHVTPVVLEALQTLAGEHARPVVRLHPEDAALLSDALDPLLAARGVQLVADPAVSPGGCVVETPRASVDATLQTRWRRTLAAIGRDDDWVDP